MNIIGKQIHCSYKDISSTQISGFSLTFLHSTVKASFDSQYYGKVDERFDATYPSISKEVSLLLETILQTVEKLKELLIPFQVCNSHRGKESVNYATTLLPSRPVPELHKCFYSMRDWSHQITASQAFLLTPQESF